MRTALLLLVCGPALAADPVRVELPDRAAVGAAVVTVADVARLSGGDPATREAIGKLDLADRPARTDTALTVTRKQVEFRLRLAGLTDFELSGADRVMVTVARKAVQPEEVVSAAKDSLRKRLPWSADDLSIEVVGQVAAKLPEAAAGDEVTISAEPHAGAVNLGRTQMDVTIRVGGERRFAVPVVLDAKLFQTVSVVTKTIPAGEPLTEANTRTERRAVDVSRRFLPANEVAGRKVTRALTPGHTLSSGDVEQVATEPVLVKTRQRVTLTVTVGAMTVSAAGEAMQDGKLGQMVRVQNVDSKKVLTGKVSGPGKVDIDIGGGP